MFYVYIVKCADTTLYTGYTTDTTKRLSDHNTSKRGARYTRGRRPVELVYSESFETLSEALKREAALKKWTRKEKYALFEA